MSPNRLLACCSGARWGQLVCNALCAAGQPASRAGVEGGRGLAGASVRLEASAAAVQLHCLLLGKFPAPRAKNAAGGMCILFIRRRKGAGDPCRALARLGQTNLCSVRMQAIASSHCRLPPSEHLAEQGSFAELQHLIEGAVQRAGRPAIAISLRWAHSCARSQCCLTRSSSLEYPTRK